MKWISVKERLPEDEDCVLFVSKNEIYICIWFNHWDSVSGNMAGCYDKQVKISDITHWMPLPEPPAE